MSNIVVTNGKISAVKLVTSESITTPILTANNSLIYKGKELADILDESAAGSNGPFVKLEGGNEITGNQTITGELTVTEDSESSGYPGQLYFSGIPTEMLSDAVYDLGVLNENKDLSGIRFADISTHVQTCEIWFSISDEAYDIYWPENMLWLDSTDGNAPAIVVRTEYRVAIRKEANGSMVASIAYAVGEGQLSNDEMMRSAAQKDGDNTFTGTNTFTGAVDMSSASVTPPEGWNVEGGAELTAEAIQEIVPMAWGEWTTAPSANAAGGIAIGDNALSHFAAVAIGKKSRTGYDDAISVGRESFAGTHSSIAIGANSKVVSDWVRGAGISIGAGSNTTRNYGITIGQKLNEWFSNGNKTIKIDCSTSGERSVSIGCGTNTKGAISTTIGAAFTEEVDGELVTNYCTTEGTGSITIGAGANTLNNGDTESSNSVTIGCKAENKGADSVTIGAGASNTGMPGIAIGAKAKTTGEHAIRIGYGGEADRFSMAFGSFAKATGNMSTAIGASSVSNFGSTAIGYKTRAEGLFTQAIGYAASDKGTRSFAVGYQANNTSEGVGVFSVTNIIEDTRTKLYFVGANTPLATEYYNGEAFMGYTVTDNTGKNVLACGTRRLSELFPDNSLTQPATLDENGEWVAPKVFHPSDLDMPQEEPTEPEMEEYTPLPVYPIVEPEIEEI